MTPVETLVAVLHAGGSLEVRGGRLGVKGGMDLDAELEDALRENRDALARQLGPTPARTGHAAVCRCQTCRPDDPQITAWLRGDPMTRARRDLDAVAAVEATEERERAHLAHLLQGAAS